MKKLISLCVAMLLLSSSSAFIRIKLSASEHNAVSVFSLDELKDSHPRRSFRAVCRRCEFSR